MSAENVFYWQEDYKIRSVHNVTNNIY